MRLEAGDEPPRLGACAPPRASRAPRSGGGRSRRRPRAPLAVRPCDSKRRPAPVKLGERAAPPPRLDARRPAGRQRGQRIEHVVLARAPAARSSGAVDLEAGGAAQPSSRRRRRRTVRRRRSSTTVCRSRRRELGERLLQLGERRRRSRGGPARCWSRPRRRGAASGTSGPTRRPRSPPTPPRPSAALVPAARSSPPIRKAGSRPRLEQRERDHRRGRRLPVGAAHGDRLASSARARRAGRRGGGPARPPPGPPRARGCPRGWRWRPRPPRPRAGSPRRARSRARCPAARSRSE